MGVSRIAAALDIGSTEVRAVICECAGGTPGIRVIGSGRAAASGVLRGVVTDLGEATGAVIRALEEAETEAGLDVERVALGVAGTHVAGTTARGVMALGRRRVRRCDVERALRLARESLGRGRDLLHEFPQRFVVGNGEPVSDPVGMSGVRLEAEVHFVTGAAGAMENLTRCVSRAGVEVDRLVVQVLAVAEEVLDEQEKEQGALLMDIGGAATDWAVLCGGTARRVGTVPVGGRHVTRDLATGLGTGEDTAEELKRTRVSISPGRALRKDHVRVASRARAQARASAPGGQYRDIPGEVLCEIVELRMRELLELVARGVEQEQMSGEVRSVVLTGGGSLLDGLCQLASAVLGVPARLGSGPGLRGRELAAGIGVARYGLSGSGGRRGRAFRGGRTVSGAACRIGGWLGELMGTP